jgi:hypothetical protein
MVKTLSSSDPTFAPLRWQPGQKLHLYEHNRTLIKQSERSNATKRVCDNIELFDDSSSKEHKVRQPRVSTLPRRASARLGIHISIVDKARNTQNGVCIDRIQLIDYSLHQEIQPRSLIYTLHLQTTSHDAIEIGC